MATSTFTSTGAMQSFTVPDQVTSITAELISGMSLGAGLKGKRTILTFTVTPGQVLNLYCGGNGQWVNPGTFSSGGWNGGGSSTTPAGWAFAGGGSGGATDIRIGGTALSNRVAVAGSPGGLGGLSSANGYSNFGIAGGNNNPVGDSGIPGIYGGANHGTGGTGGTQLAGGNTGGALGQGGNGTGGGGAGGAGYYGGGAGSGDGLAAGGGGGGSNFVAALINGVAPTGVSYPDNLNGQTWGSITLTYHSKPSVVASAPNLNSGISTDVVNSVFSWSGIFDSDSQSAYQIIVERNDTGAGVLDTGKVVSTSEGPTIAVNAFPTNVNLRWKVRIWDTHNFVSDYTAYTIFQYGTPPSFTVLPATGTISTAAPTVSWSNVSFASGKSMSKWRVHILQGGSSIIDVNGTTGLSYNVPVGYLINETTYTFSVSITDTVGVTKTNSTTITISLILPDSFNYTVQADNMDTDGYVFVDWSSAASDSDWIRWQVRRKKVTQTNWDLIASFTDISIHTYKDWLVEPGETYKYSVTQVCMITGNEVESQIGYLLGGPDPNSYLIVSIQYWIIDLVTEAFSTILPSVNSGPFTEKYEEQLYTLIGRGQKKDTGTRLGYSGSLSAQLRGYYGEPALVRACLDGIRLAQDTCYLRTPFGDLFQISLGEITYTPLAGVGSVEMYDITVPFDEVTGDTVEEAALVSYSGIYELVDAAFFVDNGDGTVTIG